MSSKSKVLLGILGAAAAGVVIGLLVAPETGKDTRKKIKQTAGEWADSFSDLIARGKESAEEAYANVKEKARNAKGSAEDKANRVKENFS